MDMEGGAESAGFPMEAITTLLMPRRWYLNAIDLEGTRPTADVFKEVSEKAFKYYQLVVLQRDEGKYRIKEEMELYELFHWLRRETT